MARESPCSALGILVVYMDLEVDRPGTSTQDEHSEDKEIRNGDLLSKNFQKAN